MGCFSKYILQLPRGLRRYPLITPIFLVITICLWTASTIFPFSILHVCISGRRVGLHCFPSQSSAFSLDMPHVSTHISEVVVQPHTLKLEDMLGQSSPIKPAKEVEILKEHWDIAGPSEEKGPLEPLEDEEGPLESPDGVEPPNETFQPTDLRQKSENLSDAHIKQEEFGRPKEQASDETNNTTAPEEGLEDQRNLDLKQEEFRRPEQPTSDQTNKTTVLEEGLQDQTNSTTVLAREKGPDIVEPPIDLESAPAAETTKSENVKEADDLKKEGEVSTTSPQDQAAQEMMRLMENMRRAAAPVNQEDIERWLLTKGNNSSCGGKKVYIYNLPSRFNTDLMEGCDRIIPWFNMCKFVVNSGMGELIQKEGEAHGEAAGPLVPAGRWYVTHQYALEMVFHSSLQKYACLTSQPEEADLFYIPYYGGLDVLRWHFRSNVSDSQRDQLSLELLSWLDGQPWWRRNNGNDHVLVLGKISWDFRRVKDADIWGSQLLLLPQMQEVTKLLIERDPWDANDLGVPHPTFFHPRTDADVRIWQERINSSDRRHLVSFAGLPRPKRKTSIRTVLIEQCLQRNDSCYFLRCVKTVCLEPENIMSLFLYSHFCLQPPGDSRTRRSIFDSLIAGCIPVLFDPYSAYFQYPWHLPANSSDYSVFIAADDVRAKKVNVVEVLEKIPESVRDEVRRRIINEVMPGLLYAEPGAKLTEFDDAFDISLSSLLRRVANTVGASSATS